MKAAVAIAWIALASSCGGAPEADGPAAGGAGSAPAESGYAANAIQFARVSDGTDPGLEVRPPVPWASFLAGPGNAQGRLELGGELRWVQLGAVGHPLEARVRVPRRPAAAGDAGSDGGPARVVVDLLAARRMPGDPADPHVVVTVHQRDRELARTVHRVDSTEVWSTVVLPFELPAEDAGEASGRAPAVRVRLTPRSDFTAGPAAGTFYVAAAGGVVDRPVDRAPTVLLVTSDTHRGDHVSAAGLGVPVETPALDGLAARGVLFEDCFAPSHVTLPSHAALFTGTSPRDTGVLDNNTALDARAPTLAEAFADAGWLTAAAVSLDLLVDTHSGFGQGFARLSVPTGTRRGAETVDAALRWLEGSAGRPVFLWVHLADAHAPYEPPQGPAGLPAAAPDPFDPERPRFDQAPHWLPEVREAEYVRALYRGEVGYVDAQLARLLEHPRVRAGVAAVTADHGEVLGRHDIWWRHKDLYPDTLHVPLILAWPGAPAGARVAAPVELLDLGRTLLDRVGLTDVRFPGRDLGELAEGAATASRPRFSIATGWRSAAVSVDGWHLILHLRDSHRVELFERATDRYCERDLADTEVERARALRALLVEWLGDAGEGWTGVQGADPAMLERLAELGYSDQLEPGGPGGAGAPDPDCACDWCGRFGPRR